MPVYPDLLKIRRPGFPQKKGEKAYKDKISSEDKKYKAADIERSSKVFQKVTVIFTAFTDRIRNG